MQSFSSLFCREYKLIWYLTTMYIYCVYPAISKSPKQLPNCFQWCQMSDLYCYHFCLLLHMNQVPEILMFILSPLLVLKITNLQDNIYINPTLWVFIWTNLNLYVALMKPLLKCIIHVFITFTHTHIQTLESCS